MDYTSVSQYPTVDLDETVEGLRKALVNMPKANRAKVKRMLIKHTKVNHKNPKSKYIITK